MTSEDVEQEVWRRRAEHTSASGESPTRVYLGFEQVMALRRGPRALYYLDPRGSPPSFMGLRLYIVNEDDHLHVC